LCAFTGILAIALPVPVIVANFEHFYSNEQNEAEESVANTKSSKYSRVRNFFKELKNRRKQNHAPKLV
jgi:hypothetical protein